MARKTARKSRKRSRRSRRSRRHRGGFSAKGGVAATASEISFEDKPVVEDVAKAEEAPKDAPKQEGGKRKRRSRKSKKKRGGGGCGLTDDSMSGGKRKSRKKKGGKRKLNAFFKAMLDAKKSKAKSFSYKGKTYVGKQHKRLGMIYKKK